MRSALAPRFLTIDPFLLERPPFARSPLRASARLRLFHRRSRFRCGAPGLLGRGLGGGSLLLHAARDLLLDLAFLAGEVAEVVEASATDLALALHDDVADLRRVQREHALDAFALDDATDGE